MRNLKRTLSLLLTAAMLIGMMVVGASAASSSDFTDSDEITNIEAAQVMTALGVFEGTDSGAFDPNGTLTREQAAAIICRMLLGEDAEELTTNSVVFSDVSADRWSAGYIGYCAQQGILAGTGNGAFDPEGELTGLAFAKMCLVALGYNADSEGYVGTDWAINVAADAVNAGISPSGLVLANVISREDAAQMAFQTLEADMVTYTGSGSTSVTIPDGSSVVITGAADTIAADQDDDYRGYSDGDEVQQFCEYYFPDLTKDETGEDSFQRPSVTWLDGRTESGTFSETADATFTTTAETGELYDAVGRTVYNDLTASDPTNLYVYVDGEEVDYADFDLDDFIARNCDDTAGVRTSGGDLISDQRTGNGVLTEVFVDDDNNVTITMIHTYVAQVEGDYDSTDGKLDLNALDGTAMAATDLTVYDEDFDNLDTFSDGDYVLLTVADGEIQTIALADTVDGDVTAYTEGSSVTVDGTRYYYNRTFESGLATDSTALDYDLNEAYTLVLDEYGYVVYSDATEGTSDYVFVSRVAATGGVSDSAEARAYFTDGTYGTIEMDEDSEATHGSDKLVDLADSSTSNYETINEWYDYDEQSDGSYELNDISESGSDTLTGASGGTDIAVSGSAYVYYGNASGDRIRANSSTVFVINDDGDVSSYTGIRNVPDVTLRSGASGRVAWVMDDDNYADAVYIYSENMSVSGGSDDRVYILDDSASRSVDSEGNSYYEYDAIVNGEVGTIRASDNSTFTDIGLYNDISYDSDEYVNDAELITGEDGDFDYYGLEDVDVIYSSGVLSFENSDVAVDLALADDYTIFVNDDGDAETVTASSLARDYDTSDSFTGTVYVFLNDDGEVAEVYVCYDSSTSSGGSTGGGSSSDVEEGELGITALSVKGVAVSFSGTTGTVTLGTSAVDTDLALFEITTNEDADVSVSGSTTGGTATALGGTASLGPSASTLVYSIILSADGYDDAVYTVRVTLQDLMAVTLTNTDNATVTGLADGDYVVKGEDITFTVSAASNMEIDTVTYTVDSNSPVEITASGSSYTLPSAATSAGTTITVTINQVGGYNYATGSFAVNVTASPYEPYDGDVEDVITGIEQNSYFDGSDDVTFTVTAPEGYYLQFVSYPYVTSGSNFTQIEADEDGTYTIPASVFEAGDNTTDGYTLRINVRLHENPEITFGTGDQYVLVDNSTITSSSAFSVEYGGDFSFQVQTGYRPSATGVTFTMGDSVNGYVTWTVTDVTEDIAISVSNS